MSDTAKLLGPGTRVKHPAYGEGAIIKLYKIAYEVCFMQYGLKTVGKDYDKWEIIEHLPAETAVSFTEAEKSLARVLRQWSGFSELVEIGDRWKGGTIILKPEDDDMKPKEIPMETFWHKIVMVRDRLRVMEQRINSSKHLSEDDKVNLQQYLTRIYGSLTTFNVLFKYKQDSFVGEKSR